MPLFDRQVEVLVGQTGAETALKVTGLHVSFSVKKTAKPDTNSCTVTIWNLNNDQRSKISTSDGVMILKAGYAQDTGPEVLYIGDIAFAEHKRQAPDILTVLNGEDGFRAMSETRVSLSYKDGTGAKQILKDVLKQFNLATRSTIEQVLSQIPESKFTNGFSATGQAKDVLLKITSKLSLEWSVQNQEIKVLRRGGVDNSRTVVLAPGKGLIGSPQRRRETASGGVRFNGWSVLTLLQPNVEPGGTVKLECADVPAGAKFRVETVEHSGDTESDSWQTALELTDL